VKLCPFSSVKSAILSLTWGAPSLLQNNARAPLRPESGQSVWHSQDNSGRGRRIEGDFAPSWVHCRWVSVSSSKPESFLQDTFAVHTMVGIESSSPPESRK
jgi:hypothetical protein